MLGYLLSKLKIAVYVDYFEFVNLLIKQKEQTTPSKLKIIIDLPWKERQMPIGSSDALLELYRQTMPKGRLLYLLNLQLLGYRTVVCFSLVSKHSQCLLCHSPVGM
ncbi:hypothetical protein EB796_016835 [Bugula neritina]|uniref:Uncharacterized protein n=1 Tax=Bugula neritina TaxID=10212 RepID=A0A7J7JFN6_BUGNE|nr:hypothetical protein EB796_016835 [Bugula neritina]